MNPKPRQSPPTPRGEDRTAVPPPEPPVEAAAPVVPLTPEEQMAAFEQELKETDWGHQPC